MIKGTKHQGTTLIKVLEEVSKNANAGFEISQEQYRSPRPGTITVNHLDRTGKVYRIDKIKPSGEHLKGEV